MPHFVHIFNFNNSQQMFGDFIGLILKKKVLTTLTGPPSCASPQDPYIVIRYNSV